MQKTLAATLAEVEAETVGYTLDDLCHFLSSKDTIVQIGHLLRCNGLKFGFHLKSFKISLRDKHSKAVTNELEECDSIFEISLLLGRNRVS